MIAVIFEVEPADGRKNDYLGIAAEMRSMLDQIEGIISVERFQRLTGPRKILSLSIFEDEAAIARWRNLSAHRAAQMKGRSGVFDDYRLRIASVIRDYGMFDRDQASADSRKVLSLDCAKFADGIAAAGPFRAALGIVLPLHQGHLGRDTTGYAHLPARPWRRDFPAAGHGRASRKTATG